MKEVVGVCVVCVVLAAMLPFGAADQHLGFVSVTCTGTAALVGALPVSIPDRLGVILAMSV